MLSLRFRILPARLRERKDFAEVMRIMAVILIRKPFHFRVKEQECHDGEDDKSRSAEPLYSVFHLIKKYR